MALVIEIYWAIGIISIVVYLLIHYFEIAPLLRKHNSAGILTWLTNIRDDEDLEKYKNICVMQQKSLYWYQFLKKMNKYTIPYIIGWFITLLCGLFFVF